MDWSRFLHRSRWDAERKKELQDYLAHEIDDNIARGMSAETAERAAHRKLGNTTRIREDIYDMNTLPWIDAAWQDLRYAARLLLKNRTFAIVSVLTLALGTGANAAIFQLVNAVRLRTLPVEKPHELVSIGINNHGKGRTGRGYAGRAIHTLPIYRELQRQQQPFSALIAWGIDSWNLSSEGEFVPARGIYASGNYFETLGVQPHLGRMLTASDDRAGCGTPAAVLSHAYWQSQYGANPGVVGQAITLDRHPFTIVGVAPSQFFGTEVGSRFDIAVPLCAEPLIRGAQAGTGAGREHVWWLDIIGRLKPGWTVESAAAHLDAISESVFRPAVAPRWNADIVQTFVASRFTAQSAATGVSNLRRQFATPIWVLFGATGLVLLLTCVNLASLMLARATARSREIAVRLAIGASRGRVVRQLLSEGLVIAALGAGVGLLLAQWLSQTLVTFMTTAGNRLFVDLTLDWRVFAFMTLLAVVACLLFGLSPALKATRTDPARTMQVGGRASSDTHEAIAVRRGLVVMQVAISLVLIVGALLFARSLRNLAGVDLGFRADGLIRASIDLRPTQLKPDMIAEAAARMVTQARGIPGVLSATSATIVPMTGTEWNDGILLAGTRQNGAVYFNQVAGTFFETFETPLVAGRTFDARDRIGSPPTSIVNETFARRYFANTSPIGETFQMPGAKPRQFEIVGVVRDTKYLHLRQEPAAIAYFALSQEADPDPRIEIIVRSDAPLASLKAPLTRAILDEAPGASIGYVTLSWYLRNSLITERVMASLSAFFGVLAMLIASIGLYGVVSYMVTRRQTEIGVRMALGAEPRAVVGMVLAESGWLLAMGGVIGVVLAFFASRPASTLLFGIEPWDPISFGLAIGTLGLVTMAAAWFPARRASRIQPTLALRE